jgi:FKBP12-rapamycin complex-associated protein
MKYTEISNLILRHKDHRDGLVRRTVISLIPVLASFDTASFVEHHLAVATSHLLVQLNKDKDRPAVFVAIGKVALVVRGEVGGYLEAILLNVKEGLQAGKGGKKVSSEGSILECIRMLADAVGPALTKYMHELFDHMFAGGLTEQLRVTLVEICLHIPPLHFAVQERLLVAISYCLLTQVKSPVKAVDRTRANSVGLQANREMFTGQAIDAVDVNSIILCLNILGTFDFSNHISHQLVRDYSLPYIDDDNADGLKVG